MGKIKKKIKEIKIIEKKVGAEVKVEVKVKINLEIKININQEKILKIIKIKEKIIRKNIDKNEIIL